MSENQGNFLTGFTIGLFAGAGGYFIFGTKKGDQVRQQLMKEWEKAKSDLVKQGVIEEGKSLRELLYEVVEKLDDGETTNQKDPSASLRMKKTKTKKPAAPGETKKKFKGI